MEKLEELKIIRKCTAAERQRLLGEVFPRMGKPPSFVKETIDGHPVIIVNCNSNLIEIAKDVGDIVHKAAELRKLTEYLESNPEWRESGFMGQFAVEFYFSGDWMKALEVIPIGKADNGDMELGNFVINVMTRARLFDGKDEAIIDKRRFKRKPYPLYVVCSRMEDKIIIWGYARWDEVKNWKTKSYSGHPEAYYQNVNALHPIEELKDLH